MSIIPAFKIGLWNAWVLIVPMFIILFIGIIINKEKFEEPPVSEKEQRLFIFSNIILFSSLIYSFFLPLKLKTFLLYIGLVIYLAGLIFFIVAEVNFRTTPKEKVVNKGVYRISRNPMFLGGFLMFIGTGIACISWVFPLFAVIYIIIINVVIDSEERFCLMKFGKEYKNYMDMTPRWIGLTKRRIKD
jgi:protein-S-isoprenylcysteine O-methyltransferase Ste14